MECLEGMVRQLDVYGGLAVFGNDNNFAPVINAGSWEFKEPDKPGVARASRPKGTFSSCLEVPHSHLLSSVTGK